MHLYKKTFIFFSVQGPRGPILNLLNDDERENVYKLFADYRTLLMSTSFQISNMICIVEGYERLTFDRDRLSELRRPDGPIDVDRLSQVGHRNSGKCAHFCYFLSSMTKQRNCSRRFVTSKLWLSRENGESPSTRP